MENLNVGTKEIVSIDVTDRLDSLVDLSPYAVDYRVANDDGTDKVAWEPVLQVVVMRVDVLLDTAGWEAEHYELYIRPTIVNEQPILGPFDFDLV